jgi:spermidine/putrescine transport system permease protein
MEGGHWYRMKPTILAKKRLFGRSFLAYHMLVVLAFLYVPLVIVTIYSFNDSKINAVWQGFTLKWYVSLLSNERMLEALGNSVVVATVSTLLSTVLGTAAALAVQRRRDQPNAMLHNLFYLPILIPDIVMGLSLLVLFSQLQWPLGKLTLITAHVTFSISYVYLLVSARLEGLPAQLAEAAQDLGAGPWQTFRWVTFPLAMPGIISGALISFTLSLDDVMVSFFVSGPESTTLPLYIYGLVKRGISPEINALSTLMIAVTVLLVLAAERFRRKTNSL